MQGGRNRSSFNKEGQEKFMFIFLMLTDDPGAGKIIMTDLFIKELMIRGDLRRCKS